MQRTIEAILFAAGERMEIQRLADVLETDPDEIENAVGNYLIAKGVPIIDFYSHNYQPNK